MGDDLVRGEDNPVRDEDDHDLLTFSESGIRLREEISLTKAALRACSGADRPARAASAASPTSSA